MKDRVALEAAIARVEGAELLTGNRHKLYTSHAEGIGIKLPNWHYPVVINPETGEAKYDNYNGGWGKQELLDALVQGYAVEKTRMEAIQAGRRVEEELDEATGDIRVKLYDYVTA